jgi:hypothetical protein
VLQSECSRNKRANTRAGKGMPGNKQASIVVDSPNPPSKHQKMVFYLQSSNLVC